MGQGVVYISQNHWSVRDQWNCRKSSMKSQRGHLICFTAVLVRWTVVGRIYGMSLLFTQYSGSRIRWRKSTWTAFWRTSQWCQSYHLERQSNIIRYQQKIRWDAIKFGKTVLSGVFKGYVVNAGVVGKQTSFEADVDWLKDNDASEEYSKTWKQKILYRKKETIFLFPFVNGSVELARQRLEIRPSNRIRQDVKEGEGHHSDLQEETDEADSAEQQREQDKLEAKHNFWSISGSFICRHHVQERQDVFHKKARF